MLKKVLVLVFIFSFWAGPSFGQTLEVKNLKTDQWPEVWLSVRWTAQSDLQRDWSLRILPEGPEIPAKSVTADPAYENDRSHLIVALDISQSISKNYLEAAQSALGDMSLRLTPREQLCLLTFSDTVEVNSGFSNNAINFFQQLSDVKLKGQKTALYKALIESFNLLKNITGRKTVLLISDGRNEDASVSQMDVLNFASAYKIQVIVLALIQNNNTPAQETFLTNLARETGGQYIRINGPDSLGVPIYEFAQQRAALPVVEPTLNVVFNIPPEYVPDKNKVEVLLKKSVGDGEVNQSLTLKVPLEKVQAPAAQ